MEDPKVPVDPLIQGDLTMVPLYNRKSILQAVVKPKARYLEVLPCERVNASSRDRRGETAHGRLAVVVERFETSIVNNEEGIMIKVGLVSIFCHYCIPRIRLPMPQPAAS